MVSVILPISQPVRIGILAPYVVVAFCVPLVRELITQTPDAFEMLMVTIMGVAIVPEKTWFAKYAAPEYTFAAAVVIVSVPVETNPRLFKTTPVVPPFVSTKKRVISETAICG